MTYDLGLKKREIQKIAGDIPGIEVLLVNEGDAGALDPLDHFSWIAIRPKDWSKVEALPLRLESTFGPAAARTNDGITLERLRDLNVMGVWVMIQSVVLPYAGRRGLVSWKTEGPITRIMSTIPIGLMSEKEDKEWWTLVIDGIKRAAAGF